MIDTNELRQSLGAVQPEEVAELLDRLEAAEKERTELRAKIEVMEKQEPIGWVTEDYQADKSATTYNYEIAKRWRNKGWPVSNLYALPGAQAQPAPSMPVVTPKMEQAFYEKVEVTSVGSIRGLADGIKAAILAAAPNQEKDNGSI